MKSLKAFILILSLLAFDQACAIDVFNIIKSATDVSVGMAKNIGNILPKPAQLFDMGKQAIAGYPFEFVSTAINKICSAALASDAIRPRFTPDITKMNFQLRTDCERISFPLLEANQMWRSPKFDATKKVVILATGWTTTVNETDTIDVFAKAYNCRGDVNFVAVDVASFVNTLYTWSALNTDAIGEALATGLVQLSKIVPIGNIHLIGHSLGAHIVGAAARKFNYLTGHLIEHITGLDPAKPCFNEGENLSGLQRGDAAFVDVVHSNPGVLGKRNPTGDVDFYPGGLAPLPRGCLTVICAHMRAWEYYAETVYPGNEDNFLGNRCNSLTNSLSGKCPGVLIPMGYAVPRNVKGNYFLDTNSASPFGLFGSIAREAELKDCGLCRNAGKEKRSVSGLRGFKLFK